jgi:uncharacterized membrane protein
MLEVGKKIIIIVVVVIIIVTTTTTNYMVWTLLVHSGSYIWSDLFFYFLVDYISKPIQVFDSLPFLVNAATNYFSNFVFLYLGQKPFLFS